MAPQAQSDTVNGFGYTSGGQAHSTAYYNVIDKFSFTSNGNATDVGDLGRTLKLPRRSKFVHSWLYFGWT